MATRQRGLLPAAAQPRSAGGRHLGPARAHGRSFGAAAEQCWPNRAPANIYDATKLAQEHILAAWTAAHDTRLSALRLQNVYGRGQSLTNSYTGIVALFERLVRERRALDVYEDGQIVRDFVYIDDVVEALFAAIGASAAEPRCLDIWSGIPTTIHELARTIAGICDAPEPVVVAKFRDGDVRAARCDIEPTTNELEWRPQRALKDGLRALLDWIGEQPECPSNQAITA